MDKLNDYGHIAKEYAEKFIDYLPTLLGAIALLLIGLWVIKIIVKYIEKNIPEKRLRSHP